MRGQGAQRHQDPTPGDPRLSMEPRKKDDPISRIALSIVVVVSLAVGGFALTHLDTSQATPIDSPYETQLATERTEPIGDLLNPFAMDPLAVTDETLTDASGSTLSEFPASVDAGGDSSLDLAGHRHRRVSFRGPTTTTTQGSTTTTLSSGTTTVPSTTTIGSASGTLDMPATVPYPGGVATGEGFSLEISCGDTEADQSGNPPVECDLNPQGKRGIARFEYFAHGMPYLYPEALPGNHDHAWWIAGEREGYRCAYGFMLDKHPNPFGMFDYPRPSEIIARATIVRPLGQGYGKVNDANMAEGQRYYDGTPYTGNTPEIPDQDCQATALDDFDYDDYEPQGPDEIRVGLFRADGAIGDIRDFTDITPLVPGHFEFISLANGRATIVFILGATNRVSHVFYYDALNSGRIAVEVNGQLHQ